MSKENDTAALAKVMATFNFLQGKKVTYGQIERFLKKNFETGPLIIFSCAKDQELLRDRPSQDSVRISWNKRSYGGLYKVEHVNELFKRALENPKEVGKISFQEKNFYLFSSGENSTQNFFGLFEMTRVVDQSVLKLFNLFVTNISKGWNRLDELKKVENLVHVDDVTGLYNQRKLLKDIELAVERYREFKEVFTILFIDIDHFKNVNDGHGHLVGTQLLTSLGELLKTTLRESDLIYRYGGDEFVMIIPDVDGETGKLIGDRVLEAVKNENFHAGVSSINKKDSNFHLTVSIGVATFPEDAKNQEEILSMADKMMYEAKKTGRGRVCYTRDILEIESNQQEVK